MVCNSNDESLIKDVKTAPCGKPFDRVIGYDANALYAGRLRQELPTGPGTLFLKKSNNEPMTGKFMGNMSNGFSKSSKGLLYQTYFLSFFVESISWLEHEQKEMRKQKPDFTIQHYWTIKGEKRFINMHDFIYVDGFATDSNETYAYEYFGCFHHACSHCGTNPDKKDFENQRRR